MIKDNGGVLKSSVSKALDYLLVGDDPGSKLDKAKKAGVKVIFEEDFLKMVGK
jgi:DNA ligase (NAD+)